MANTPEINPIVYQQSIRDNTDLMTMDVSTDMKQYSIRDLGVLEAEDAEDVHTFV